MNVYFDVIYHGNLLKIKKESKRKQNSFIRCRVGVFFPFFFLKYPFRDSKIFCRNLHMNRNDKRHTYFWTQKKPNFLFIEIFTCCRHRIVCVFVPLPNLYFKQNKDTQNIALQIKNEI